MSFNGPTLACLLPVRNGVADLPGYLESAARFADVVLALDDGSTDETSEALSRSSLVDLVARNPSRPTFAGWDDRANRQRLLEAAIEGGCRWALYLDVDERISADDAPILRRFAEDGADPAEAYLFRVFRMIEDGRHYDQCGLWVARMFAPTKGQALPRERLHLIPVPTAIPRERWRRTTLRIQHLAGMTTERRRSRLRKYEQADPRRRWQSDYRALLEPNGRPRSWLPREQGSDVLAPSPNGGGPPAGSDPVISVIVISRDDEAIIEGAVRAAVGQHCSFPFEVIVVCSGRDRTAEVVRERFPQVRVIELPRPALPGEARNAGLRAARGELVTFPGSHIRLAPGSLEARVQAHRRGFEMVTDTVLNGTLTRSGWASYFLDHGGSLPDRPSGELANPPGHCSYVRRDLLELGGFPERMRAGEDTIVNAALWDRGRTVYRAAEIRIVHHTPCSNPIKLARHHFQRGRAWARITRMEIARGEGGHWRLLRMLVIYARRRLTNTDDRVRVWGEGLARRYREVRPLVVFAICAAWAGIWAGALDPRPVRESLS